VDAARALVDELANITTTRDGKEEMVRCEEIFRQICWLEERFWPDVDGMGEEDESARMAPAMGPMGAATENGMQTGMPNGLPIGINNNMAGPGMNGNGNGMARMNNMHGNNVNGSMSGSMSNSNAHGNANGNMNGAMSNGLNNPNVNKIDNTPVNDNRNNFRLPNGNSMENVGQGS
jgi:hypothetical protein